MENVLVLLRLPVLWAYYTYACAGVYTVQRAGFVHGIYTYNNVIRRTRCLKWITNLYLNDSFYAPIRPNELKFLTHIHGSRGGGRGVHKKTSCASRLHRRRLSKFVFDMSRHGTRHYAPRKVQCKHVQ